MRGAARDFEVPRDFRTPEALRPYTNATEAAIDGKASVSDGSAPARTIEPMEPPPDSARPTTAMLKGDIDSGRTGDKNPVFDPGLSPLGTDDEAAGRPPSALRVALARRTETVGRWSQGAARPAPRTHKHDGLPVVFIGFIVAVAVALVVGMWLVGTALGPARA